MPAIKTSGVKTDNHYLADKVALRAGMVRELGDRFRVLDCYGGHGRVWRAVERMTGQQVDRVAIDMRTDLVSPHLHGDNVKVMTGLDLSKFDVIDLDAYGVPAEQLELVFRSEFRGVVFVTMIQTMTGAMPKSVGDSVGMPPSIYTTAPSLFARRGWEYFCAWMYARGVDRIRLREKNRKRYFGFVYHGPRASG
jgi:hypothetical protein